MAIVVTIFIPLSFYGLVELTVKNNENMPFLLHLYTFVYHTNKNWKFTIKHVSKRYQARITKLNIDNIKFHFESYKKMQLILLKSKILLLIVIIELDMCFTFFIWPHVQIWVQRIEEIQTRYKIPTHFS